MPPLYLLIKPASGNCNLRCRYCFYHDEMKNRSAASAGMMKPESLEILIEKALRHADVACTFAFQGGEPTLAGMPFFEHLIECEKKYNVKRLTIHNAIQTNGVGIDEKWASFLAANHFLTGISLDGIRRVNDLYRIDPAGRGTFDRITRGLALMEAKRAEFNILTVVTAESARRIRKIYDFYKSRNWRHQQYIPCLEPLGCERGGQDYSLTPELYGKFLMDLFDLWYADVIRGEFVSNRWFENLVGRLPGKPPELCGTLGRCTLQWVVEADGSVYPCDFYALDRYRLGNIFTDGFDELSAACEASGFVQQSLAMPPQCLDCKWFGLCRGGCRRDRDYWEDGLGLNYYCESYLRFFEHAGERLAVLAARLR